ncbi:ADP-ribosylglycohydrolase family protein [Metabacillus sp. RGM 3146]|uniref:ADP-ribosylglycohydrolase family protein n=1 Tax=Metabacillus sp. RGM 3146 TaxID=3401092 RepID=UPI003B996F20
MLTEQYLEKIYAGFLGMNAGIRLGAPIEPIEWTYKRIREVYGDIKAYVKEYKTFSADDDVNGPVFFIRALLDDAFGRELKPEDVGKAWQNYIRDGIGMIWWGGEAISTEHTAFLNLKKGMLPPLTGSSDTNGIILAEQIGGQIFIDTWGLLFPGNIEKAADYAEKAASVSHDKNGLYGARFMAACISKAFFAKNVTEILEAGLSVIPNDSIYYKAASAVSDFHRMNPDDFRACQQYLELEWGYDKFPGICHIIPNAAVCVLALLYSAGDFSRMIEIAVMCGWDTDCNAGNVGTIAGVLNGIEGIPDHYRKPINDTVITSSVSGYLNNLDIPSFSKELLLLSSRLSGAKVSRETKASFKKGEVYFDFILPGSTHGFKTDNPFKTILRHTKERGFRQNGSLEIIIDRMTSADKSKIYYKLFYRRADFNDEKYKPVFSPKAYSGQIVSVQLYFDQWSGEEIIITPYVRNTFNQKEITLQPVSLVSKIWNCIEFQIPDTEGACIDEVGYIIKSSSTLANRAFGRILMDEFHIYGNADYHIDFSKQCEEFKSITPFSHHKGIWRLDGGHMISESIDDCSAYTGNYYAKDLQLSAVIAPLSGNSHLVIVRAGGIKRHYLAGFDGEGKVSFILNDFGYTRLKTVPYKWTHGQKYLFEVECKGECFAISINGDKVLEQKDPRFQSGMYGVGSLNRGSFIIGDFKIREIN